MSNDTPDGRMRVFGDEFATLLGQRARFVVYSGTVNVDAGDSESITVQAPESGYLYHVRSFNVVSITGISFKAFLYFNVQGMGYIYVNGMYTYYVPSCSPMFLTYPDTMAVNCFNAEATTQTFKFNIYADKYMLPTGWVKRPVAGITVDYNPVSVGQTVHFQDDSDNTPTSWDWDFGDGSTSNLQNPTHVYLAAGVYTVTLFVSNAGGVDVKSGTMTVT